MVRQQTTQPQKILILAAIPYGLRLDREIREVEECIRRAVRRDMFEVVTRTAVRPQDIRRAIAEEKPQIVHFCGHGLKDGSLLLEDEGGQNKAVPPEGLAALFELHADCVNCVLLNACYSVKSAEAISEYIKYAIGMNQEIQDELAIKFAQGFYDGLDYATSENQAVFPRAFKEGLLAVIIENFTQAQIPVLKTKLNPNDNPIIEDTSPFVIGPPIIHPRHFFGRQKELKRLFNLLKRHPLQNAAIIGKRRIGKTSLLHYLKNITTTPPQKLCSNQKSEWLPNPEIYQWIFVDFQDPRMASRERFLSYILENIGMKVTEPCDLDNFMDVVSDNLHNPTVILLDEIGVGLQRCPELDDGFWESLRSLATNHTGGNLAFILATHESPIDLAHHTGHSSPFFNIFGYTAYLGALTEEEARELIASSPVPFPDEDVEWILEKSQRLPLLLQILCLECLFNLEDGNTDDWREEGLRQIEPFAHLLEK